jgi:hypothetical protein
VSLHLIRELESRYPEELEELYRRGSEYLVVWTVPEELADGSHDERGWWSAITDGGDAPAGDQTVCFRADADGTVTDWRPIARAIGPSGRDTVLAQLRDARGDLT